jgi:hypothetical protein
MTDVNITQDANLTTNTSPALTDRLLLVRNSDSVLTDITPDQFMKILNLLTADSSPLAADKIITYDAVDGVVKSVLLSALFTSPVLTTPQINDTSSDHQYVFAASELTADRTVTLPLLTGNDVFVFADFIQTLTNKRITPRVDTSQASHATPTLNTDSYDVKTLTAQAEAITSMTTNLSGTPTNSQKLHFAITGTAARAITWGASFESGAATLPTTTITTQRLDVGFMYNSATSKFRCMAVGSA